MNIEAAIVDVTFVAVNTFVGSFSCVKPLVQFEMNKLGELCRAQLALVGLFSRVESEMSL